MEDTHSIVLKAKISTPVEEIAARAMCKVKGFEKFLSQILAEGTHDKMNKKLDDMDGKEGDQEDGKNELPPRKRKRMALLPKKPELGTNLHERTRLKLPLDQEGSKEG